MGSRWFKYVKHSDALKKYNQKNVPKIVYQVNADLKKRALETWKIVSYIEKVKKGLPAELRYYS